MEPVAEQQGQVTANDSRTKGGGYISDAHTRLGERALDEASAADRPHQCGHAKANVVSKA